MIPPRCRPVWAVLALIAAPAFAGEDQELFNGRDLAGWVVEGPRTYKDRDGKPQPMWRVQDGLLVCAGRAFGFLRYDRQRFRDFLLHVEFRMAPRANSGIGIRTGRYDPRRSKATRPSHAAYEVQLLDDAGRPPTRTSSGALYGYVAPTSCALKPSPQWNSVDVECVGPRIRVTMNGRRVIDFDQRTREDTRDKPLEGYVCLQSHTHRVAFRNVRIRPIPAGSANGRSSPGGH